MNLHSIVFPYIAAVNPMVSASIRVSVGTEARPGGVRAPLYATPGAFMGSIAGTTMTVETISEGKIQEGQTLAREDGTIAAGTMVIRAITGTGGPGTYEVSREQTVGLGIIEASLLLPVQLQPMTFRDLAQTEGINTGGQKQGLYVNGDLNGIVRVELKGGDLVVLPNGETWLVVQQLEGFNMTAGWSKCAVVLQN